jgi:hypothetical protein
MIIFEKKVENLYSLANSIWVINSAGGRRPSKHGETRNIRKLLLRKPEGKIPPGTSSIKWKLILRQICLK